MLINLLGLKGLICVQTNYQFVLFAVSIVGGSIGGLLMVLALVVVIWYRNWITKCQPDPPENGKEF